MQWVALGSNFLQALDISGQKVVHCCCIQMYHITRNLAFVNFGGLAPNRKFKNIGRIKFGYRPNLARKDVRCYLLVEV